MYFDGSNIIDNKLKCICHNDCMVFLCKDNVVGIGIGYKKIRSITTREKCLTIFVTKKVPEIMLSSKNVIPRSYKGITTDVVESGVFYEAGLTDKVRPTQGGYSISNEFGKASGTLTCLVKDRNQDYYILGNNHVLALGNNAPIGSLILQPGITDKGVRSTDAVAILSKFIPLKYKSGLKTPTNYVDCAVAKVINKNLVSSAIAFNGIPEGTIVPRLEMPIKKVGRTTGYTTGIITHINTTMRVRSVRGELLYKDQIITEQIAKTGDSGSLLMDLNNNAVGLLISTISESNIAVYNPINAVLSNLDVRIVTN